MPPVRVHTSPGKALCHCLLQELGGLRSELAESKSALDDAGTALRREVDALAHKLHGAVLSEMQKSVDTAHAAIADEARARAEGHAELQRSLEGVVVDQKVRMRGVCCWGNLGLQVVGNLRGHSLGNREVWAFTPLGKPVKSTGWSRRHRGYCA